MFVPCFAVQRFLFSRFVEEEATGLVQLAVDTLEEQSRLLMVSFQGSPGSVADLLLKRLERLLESPLQARAGPVSPVLERDGSDAHLLVHCIGGVLHSLGKLAPDAGHCSLAELLDLLVDLCQEGLTLL